MSGKRSKALRAKFRAVTGRSAVTKVHKGVGYFFRSVFDRALGKRTKEAVQHKIIVGAWNEFRRFKRAGNKTADQITLERLAFLRRREAHRAEIERNNERILAGMAA